ncbi:AAA family ATPase [Psychromonas sp. MME2]|uniref:AAA family ATPase n=1 Tax=unclassified Psychromonas TaxID=2614957 RepID=UPI00339D2220
MLSEGNIDTQSANKGEIDKKLIDEIHKYLIELIEQHKEKIVLHSKSVRNPSFISQTLEESIKKISIDKVPSKKLLLFEFDNREKHLNLNLSIGPGDKLIREYLFDLAGKSVLFSPMRKTQTEKWSGIYRTELLNYAKEQERDRDKLCNLIKDKFEKFCQEGLVEIETFFSNNVSNEEILSVNSNNNDEGSKMTDAPLNQILYGPPGTGKTYHTIEAAVKAADPVKYDELAIDEKLGTNSAQRAELTKLYKYLCNEGRIRFVTFHQSYGYEEFVEGLKALTDEDKKITYSVESGVFKKSVESARAKRINKTILAGHYNLDNRKIWKMSLGNTLTNEGEMVFKECVENDCILLGYGESIDFSGCNSSAKIKQKFTENGYEIKPQDYNVTAVNTLVNKMSEGDIVIVSDGNHKFKAIAEITSDYLCLNDDRDSYFQKRDVKWLMIFEESRLIEELFSSSLSQMTLYNLKDSVISREKLSAMLNETKEELEEAKNHVLIIDEINRGNISKIFGELITLIEPSKRQEAEEELEVILPYSGDKFSVPNNLYIIGTMNTADRSLAMMDTALRRRFDFKEMMPKPELFSDCSVNGVNLTKLLDTMNKRIEVLYDREHTLGHAFLFPAYNAKKAGNEKIAIGELQSAFQNKIIPLLEEYFYEDWSKIRLVLGDNQKSIKEQQFIRESPVEYADLFGNDYQVDEFGQPESGYELAPFDDAIWSSPEAYQSIYGSLTNATE